MALRALSSAPSREGAALTNRRAWTNTASGTPLTECREVLFSVASGEGPDAARRWFMTNACRQAEGGWKWAAAEPATERRGGLQ